MAKKTPEQLAAVILDAARRSRANVARAASVGCDTITGRRQTETAYRQIDRMEKALAALVAMAQDRSHSNKGKE